MLFSSMTFIFIFFPLCFVLYFISKKYLKKIKYRNIILCVFSLIFYAWGEPKYIFLMLFSIIINYFLAILIDKYNKHSKLYLIISIVINILLIAIFKYSNFFLDNINLLFNTNIRSINLTLPIGISFYTFQIISYVVDVYRKNVKVQKNIISLATYISLFPQLVAGPIVRYETVEKELNERQETKEKIIDGLKRFVIGLGKKVIIANNVALVADTIYGSDLSSVGTVLLWVANIAYTLQIYFDFSGYSDMAIGIGKMFGFTFLENFDYPYTASSITDFWKKWHISLSSFFRDYVYIPLGGNRVSTKKWLLNMFIVWSLTGFWHGASWNFILWGIYYFMLLVIEKKFLEKILKKLPSFIKHLYTIIGFSMGWVIFRIENINDLGIVLKNMFIFKRNDITSFLLENTNILIPSLFIVIGIIGSTRLIKNISLKYENKTAFIIISTIMYIIVFYASIFLLISSTYNPFIYYRF